MSFRPLLVQGSLSPQANPTLTPELLQNAPRGSESISHCLATLPPQQLTVRAAKCLETFGLNPLLQRGVVMGRRGSQEGRDLAKVTT